MHGKAVCYHHGGKTPVGPLNPHYQTGIYSKYLPTRFAELFAALEGRDLLDLTEDIKLLHSRLMDVAKRVDSGESGERWHTLKAAWDRAEEAAKDSQDEAQALKEVGAIVKQAASDYRAWEKIEDLVIKKTKVVESQRKRAVENQEMLTAQAARDMMRAITEGMKRAIEKHIDDGTLRNAIYADASVEFTRLVSRRNRFPVAAEGH